MSTATASSVLESLLDPAREDFTVGLALTATRIPSDTRCYIPRIMTVPLYPALAVQEEIRWLRPKGGYVQSAMPVRSERDQPQLQQHPEPRLLSLLQRSSSAGSLSAGPCALG